MEGRVLFHDADGFSYYDDMTRRMMPYEVFNESLGEFRTCDMVTDARHGRYWLIRDDRAVLAGVSSDGRADIIDFVDCSKYDMSMSEPSAVASWNDDRYLVGTEQGFLVHHYVSGQSPDSLAVKILFRGICSQKADSRQTYNISDDRITVPNKSGLSVYAALTGERFPNRIKVESMLSGYDWSWQMLGDDMTASWQRLPAGTYRLELRASDAIGHEVARKEISVTVRPSLFASPVFLILYVLSFAGLCAMAVIFVRKLLERQRTALAKKNAEAMEQEMLKHERDLMSIRNEQLEESVLLKSKVLATYSLIEARRNNVLKHLSEELSRIYYSDRPGIHKKDYDRLMEKGRSRDSVGVHLRFYHSYGNSGDIQSGYGLRVFRRGCTSFPYAVFSEESCFVCPFCGRFYTHKPSGKAETAQICVIRDSCSIGGRFCRLFPDVYSDGGFYGFQGRIQTGCFCR